MRHVTSLTIAAAVSLLSTSASALDGTLRVSNPAEPAFFSGDVTAAEGQEHYQLQIDLPAGTFSKNRPGGVQVQIKWFGDVGPFTLPEGSKGCCGELDTLHIFVFKGEELVAMSAGIIAVAQSTRIENPENGIYDIIIAYEPLYNLNPNVPFVGLAEVEHDASPDSKRALLPDLEFRVSERITFMTPEFGFFENPPAPGETCFDSEKAEEGAQTCLRFDQIIANSGEGDLEMWFTVPAEGGEHFDVSQRIHNSDGTSSDRTAGHVDLHGIHGHYHYSSFATSQLLPADAQGNITGAALRAARKVSFCVADIKLDRFGQKGDGPRQYMAPDCLFPAFSDENGDHFKQGLTRGWADVYDWYINDQYIEVSGVADGYYVLRFCADPDGTLLEKSEKNNCLDNLIHLSDVDSPDRSVQNLGVVK